LNTKTHAVLEYQLSDNSVVYLKNEKQPSIILKKDIFGIPANEIKEKSWNNTLALQGQFLTQILHTESADKKWFNLVKYSFKSKIMTPQTSYIVVEN